MSTSEITTHSGKNRTRHEAGTGSSDRFKKNLSYLFVPFMMEDPAKFEIWSKHLNAKKDVLTMNTSLPYYLFQYVAGKLDSSSDHCQCYSYRLKRPFLKTCGLGDKDSICEFCFGGKTTDPRNFFYQILEVQLYCFSTSIGILVYKLHFLNSADPGDALTDPMRMSEILFHMKDLCKDLRNGRDKHYQNVSPDDSTPPDPQDDFYLLSDKILNSLSDSGDLGSYTIFFQNCGSFPSEASSNKYNDFRPRANTLSFLDVPEKSSPVFKGDTGSKEDSGFKSNTGTKKDTGFKGNTGSKKDPVFMDAASLKNDDEFKRETNLRDDYERELYYLRHCYNTSYSYVNDSESIQRETHTTSNEICWGFTSEAAVCLVCTEKCENNTHFLEKEFYKNFNKQYLTTYILLLHQKYAIYMFLTKINAGVDGIKALEAYQDKVHRFEMDFMYTHISEVPQYDSLYVKIRNVLALDSMYTDVLEPLDSLSEDRRRKEEERRQEYEEKQQEHEKKQQESDAKMNRALWILSVLTITSAMVDGYDLIAEIAKDYWGSGISVLRVIQGLFLGIFFFIWINVVGNSLSKKIRHWITNNAKKFGRWITNKIK